MFAIIIPVKYFKLPSQYSIVSVNWTKNDSFHNSFLIFYVITSIQHFSHPYSLTFLSATEFRNNWVAPLACLDPPYRRPVLAPLTYVCVLVYDINAGRAAAVRWCDPNPDRCCRQVDGWKGVLPNIHMSSLCMGVCVCACPAVCRCGKLARAASRSSLRINAERGAAIRN